MRNPFSPRGKTRQRRKGRGRLIFSLSPRRRKKKDTTVRFFVPFGKDSKDQAAGGWCFVPPPDRTEGRPPTTAPPFFSSPGQSSGQRSHPFPFFLFPTLSANTKVGPAPSLSGFARRAAQDLKRTPLNSSLFFSLFPTA